MAQGKFAPLVGKTVVCAAERGPFAPCRYCGSQSAVVIAGTPPHALGLRCADCGKHGGWIGDRAAAAMLAESGAASDDDRLIDHEDRGAA